MRIILIIAVYLLSTVEGVCQQTGSFHFLAKPDSIIEKRQYGYIYITSDTSSKLYDWIIPNPDKEMIRSQYMDNIEEIKTKYGQEVKQFNLSGFPRKWNDVHLYKKTYYLYGPSDWMTNSGLYISDSVIYVTNTDAGDIYLIKEFNSTGTGKGNFKVINYRGDELSIDIKPINLNLGIYKWIIKKQEQLYQVFIMQNSDFSKKLKMIVCDCGSRKCLIEFDFGK